jgi:hypothetical protein
MGGYRLDHLLVSAELEARRVEYLHSWRTERLSDHSALVADIEPRRRGTMDPMAVPRCPTCGQPASQALAGPDHGWECRNEACPEFGQALADEEPSRPEPPGPGDDAGLIP